MGSTLHLITHQLTIISQWKGIPSTLYWYTLSMTYTRLKDTTETRCSTRTILLILTSDTLSTTYMRQRVIWEIHCSMPTIE